MRGSKEAIVPHFRPQVSLNSFFFLLKKARDKEEHRGDGQE